METVPDNMKGHPDKSRIIGDQHSVSLNSYAINFTIDNADTANTVNGLSQQLLVLESSDIKDFVDQYQILLTQN